jgi:hypothetical protein
MAGRLKVTYLDGTTGSVHVPAIAQVLTEREYPGTAGANTLESAFYLAFASLRESGQVMIGFEDWLRTVDDMERDEPDASAVEQI